MKISIALLALVISSLSLVLQLKGQKPAPTLEKFMVPAQATTELEHRMERANVKMIRDSIVMSKGIGVPFVREITSDHQHVIVRTLVSEKNLPQGYDERKNELLGTAQMALSDVSGELDLKYSAATKVVTVQFISIEDMVKTQDSDKIYAEFRGGELTFH